MDIIPVLDLLHGVVVRGVGGRREEYRPLVSRWIPSCEPLAVATALRDAFGWSRFYVADLDAIVHRQPNWSHFEALTNAGLQLLVDAGTRDADFARRLTDLPGMTVIAGLESLPSPPTLAGIVNAVSADRVLFSLDLRRGVPIASAEWPSSSDAIAETVWATGIRDLIVLDLADVGTSTGGSTDDLCRRLLEKHPGVRLISGGGVRGVDDLQRLQQLGVHGVLVASAVHDGRLTPEMLRQWQAADS